MFQFPQPNLKSTGSVLCLVLIETTKAWASSRYLPAQKLAIETLEQGVKYVQS